MNPRLLLACLLLVLAADACAALDRVHAASGESGGCPQAVTTEPATASEAKTDITVPVTAKPNGASNGNSTATPALPRPSLRWHSFLPGMMK